MSICIDCGAPNPTTVSDVPLCAACFALAITMVGSAARRVQMIQNHAQPPASRPNTTPKG